MFHIVSYLQYPFMVVALYFAFHPYINGFNEVFDDLNKMLIFMGLGVSFSTLQDTTKVQNKLSLRIYQNPRYSRIFVYYLMGLIAFMLVMGCIGFFGNTPGALKDISLGFLVFALSMLGLLKAVGEMIDNHGPKKDGL